ncbi:MAG: GH116 family glycosyl-hydrolase [Candidatus Methylacidiphilales bacterium]|nr:GH116 family glycosyl-hydrolase [Candidatus Methylacidiphilales bacterium]
MRDSKPPAENDSCCDTPGCCSGGDMSRRRFVEAATLATAGSLLLPRMVMAGPFDDLDWDQIIPADKKLRPNWVKSLYARGTPQMYSKANQELRFIGMPVGGICCGTIYLSGDGQLWNWDIFNQNLEGVLPVSVPWSEAGEPYRDKKGDVSSRNGMRYVRPAKQSDSQKIDQGFALKISQKGKTEVRPLDSTGWAEVNFTGQYPIGTVEYSDATAQVQVKLEAYSPFIPLNTDDSSLPATVFHITVTNRSADTATVNLAGWLQNAASFYSAKSGSGQRVNSVTLGKKATLVAMRFEPNATLKSKVRPDIIVDDFEKGYGAWKIEGEAFGKQPLNRAVIPPYQGALGGEGGSVVNSHGSAPGDSTAEKDARTGKLTSAQFKIERRFLSFYIGGGSRNDVGLRLWVDGKVVRTFSGKDKNAMHREALEVAEYESQLAVIEIFDEAGKGGWANIGVDHIVQTDMPDTESVLERQGDFGTMALAVIGKGTANPEVNAAELPVAAFVKSNNLTAQGSMPVGAVAQEQVIAAGQSAEFRFVLAWHFPNSKIPCPDAGKGNYFSKRFRDATAVTDYIANEWPRLESQTRLWRDTWVDSTLPHWFLDRTFLNTSILATTTSHRFASGRFWGWEGIGCCAGTCTHVWHYAQAVGRLFPDIERDLRERVDFGVGFIPDSGIVRHRAEGSTPAIDGHCGRILGVWREHQMSADDAFLKRLWPKVKRALEHVIEHDKDGDGILDGPQENTLDAAWFGQIAWITSLAIAALRAGEVMAMEQGDTDFAGRCRAHYQKARKSVETKLFNGEYFYQIADPKRAKSLGTYEACHIDQVHGQSWAWQVNLGRVLDREKTLSALKALWKYNFAPDVGPFRKKFTAGRPYALAGDAGLVMTTNPKLIKDVYGLSSWQIGYFNECMSGFEHQVASHMIAEGMVLEGLAVTRAIHDRYHAARRNPWNEIECSDHYSRAMASYGTFITACGFECHGPKGHLGFAPKLTPENFKAAFTSAEGWGSFSQKMENGKMLAEIALKWGTLRLRSIRLATEAKPASATVEANGKPLDAKLTFNDGSTTITLSRDVKITADRNIQVHLTL